jgi:hypothetical protein
MCYISWVFSGFYRLTPASLLLLALLTLLLLALLHRHLLAAKGLSLALAPGTAASRPTILDSASRNSLLGRTIPCVRLATSLHCGQNILFILHHFASIVYFFSDHYTLPRYFFFLILDK